MEQPSKVTLLRERREAIEHGDQVTLRLRPLGNRRRALHITQVLQPKWMRMSFDLTGKLLISTPAMGDPRFMHSVILICAYSDEGTFGLVVNTPMAQISMDEVLKQVDIAPTPELMAHQVMNGGPVDLQRGFVLHDGGEPRDPAGQELSDGLVLSASTEVLTQIGQGDAPDNWHLILGYAGWSAGQLEDELRQNAWLTCDARDDLIFAPESGQAQWQAAIRSMGIDPVSLSATAGRA